MCYLVHLGKVIESFKFHLDRTVVMTTSRAELYVFLRSFRAISR